MTSPLKQFEFAIRYAEKGGWGFLGHPSQFKEWRVGYDVEPISLSLTVIEHEEPRKITGVIAYHYDLATVLLDLSARKIWFGEIEIIYNKRWWKPYKAFKGGRPVVVKGHYRRHKQMKSEGWRYYSREMIDQGEPLKMLDWLYQYLKERKER